MKGQKDIDTYKEVKEMALNFVNNIKAIKDIGDSEES